MLTEVITKAISEYYKGMAEVPDIRGCAAHVAAEVERSMRRIEIKLHRNPEFEEAVLHAMRKHVRDRRF